MRKLLKPNIIYESGIRHNLKCPYGKLLSLYSLKLEELFQVITTLDSKNTTFEVDLDSEIDTLKSIYGIANSVYLKLIDLNVKSGTESVVFKDLPLKKKY